MIQAWIAKYIFLIGGVLLLAVLAGLFGYKAGRVHVQEKWDAASAAQLAATSQAIIQRVQENEALRLQHLKESKQRKEDYENEIAALNKRHHDGLFISKAAACDSSPAVRTPQAATSRTDDPPASIRLPGQIEQDLRALADDANRCAVKLRRLQNWAVDMVSQS
ncbi:hypothetical protein [Candidatus Nitrotoga sp. M5]|uniref:hypothetical protein n=1 Tax=Candidatus Nitrotoga sp. M5 TaxID=2890409 RepID=UPI001EF2B04E|nr:hypothetical protein [Candidatus Nitrotoga sp. M5]